MKTLVFFAKRVVFGALLLTLLVASAALVLITPWILYRQSTLDIALGIRHILLNGGNFALLLVVFIAGVYLSTRRRPGSHQATSGPASIAIMLLELSLISTIIVYAALIFSSAAVLPLKPWLDLFNLTDIAASVTVMAMIVLSYQIPQSALFPASLNAVIARVGQCVIIVCLAVAVIMLPTVARTVNDAAYGPADDYAATLIPLIWTNLAGLAGVIGLLNWRNPSSILAAIGAAAAIMTCAAAICYTLLLPHWAPPVGGWYAIVATALPLPLFLAILLRRCGCGSRQASRFSKRTTGAELRR